MNAGPEGRKSAPANSLPGVPVDQRGEEKPPFAVRMEVRSASQTRFGAVATKVLRNLFGAIG